MSDTTIEWTDKTWNPIRGCSRVSEGCRHCYAETIAGRFSNPGNTFHGFAVRTADGPHWTGDVALLSDRLPEPFTWKKPARVFVNSMSDLFHEGLTDEQIDRVFAVMALTPQHTYQVLTKRPERMRAYFRSFDTPAAFKRAVNVCEWADGVVGGDLCGGGTAAIESIQDGLPNVWLGVSVENQHFADERIPLLLQTPAAVRFISAEPLLGPVNLDAFIWPGCIRTRAEHDADCGGGMWCDERNLDWVIVGGESGPGARPFDLEWARSIVAQCQAAGVACFVKQLGANPTWGGKPIGYYDGYNLRSRKGADPTEWPEDLRVREFPTTA